MANRFDLNKFNIAKKLKAREFNELHSILFCAVEDAAACAFLKLFISITLSALTHFILND
jgi:hypothetical protein